VKIDALMDPLEYAGSTELPYTDFAIRANGKVHLRAFQSKNDVGVTVLGSLLVYLEDVPVRVQVPGLAYQGGAAYVALFLDHSRFSGATAQGDAEDRLYVLDLLQGTTAKVLRPTPNGQGGVDLYELPETFPWARKTCQLDPSTTGVWRCNAELLLRLPADAFAEPAPGLQPGVGLAMVGDFGLGSMPEEIASIQMNSGWDTSPHKDRRFAQTLLLGPPRGFPKTYMSWNVRRSSMSSLGGIFTNAVADEDVGRFLADMDVVALQEGWNLVMMSRVLNGANQRRAALGLPAFAAHGPVDFDLSTFKTVVSTLVAPILGYEGTTGGLWVYSSLPLAAEGFHSFKACKGEDCFKAKGVQWVRLYLNPPSPTNSGPTCKSPSPDNPAAGCDFPPSGGHYVDVFNTHLQASGTKICQDEALKNDLKAAVSCGLLSPVLAAACAILSDIAQKDWHCDEPDESVRAQQLQEMAQYIAGVTSERNDRPVIIMGDFNLDGRTLDYGGPNEYTKLLATLGIGPSNPPGSTSTPRSDIVNPWRHDYDWDVDHGDVARERPEIKWQAEGGRCAGTFIGELEGHEESNCDFAGNYDGVGRLDYILVKPPTPPDSPTYASASWVAKKVDGDPGVWRSPWPGFTNNHGGPGNRLSDHKPVAATIELAPLRAAPKYHEDWKHNLRIDVVSANGTGEGDCWGELDMYPRMWAFRKRGGVSELRMNKIHGFVCEDRNVVSVPTNSACMWSWGYLPTGPEAQDPAVDSWHELILSMWDADSGCGGDDHLDVVPGAWWVNELIRWKPGLVGMRGIDKWGGLILVPQGDRPIPDNDPLGHCSGHVPTQVCMRVSFPELPPGEQW
jgi:hypothetical protein